MFCDEKLSKTSYICAFILSKKRRNWFPKNLHNSGIVDHRKLPDASLNHIFNALSIGVQYTLSFRLTNFGLKCLLSGCGFKSRWSYFVLFFLILVISVLSHILGRVSNKFFFWFKRNLSFFRNMLKIYWRYMIFQW